MEPLHESEYCDTFWHVSSHSHYFLIVRWNTFICFHFVNVNYNVCNFYIPRKRVIHTIDGKAISVVHDFILFLPSLISSEAVLWNFFLVAVIRLFSTSYFSLTDWYLLKNWIKLWYLWVSDNAQLSHRLKLN